MIFQRIGDGASPKISLEVNPLWELQAEKE